MKTIAILTAIVLAVIYYIGLYYFSKKSNEKDI